MELTNKIFVEYVSECMVGKFRSGWLGTSRYTLSPNAFKAGYRLKEGIFGISAVKEV